MSRYEGKPLLRLLELYVLWCIKEIAPPHLALMEQITPKLQHTYSSEKEWYEILEAIMDLPVTMRQDIARLWNRARTELASPQAFAEAFVDAYLRDR